MKPTRPPEHTDVITVRAWPPPQPGPGWSYVVWVPARQLWLGPMDMDTCHRVLIGQLDRPAHWAARATSKARRRYTRWQERRTARR